MSIILELKEAFISIVEHNDSDYFYSNMREDTVQIVSDHGVGPDDFIDEDEYHQFIEDLMDQAERSVSMQFIPTPKLVGLVGDLNDKIMERAVMIEHGMADV